MIFLGDVHADFHLIPKLDEEIIQVGDFGIGFREKPYLPNIKFIRGNHDDPELCRKDPNYLGDYGEYKNFFFVSGAYSIDYKERTPGWDWWYNEELSHSELTSVLDKWYFSKKNMVVSHDIPTFVREKLFNIYTHSRTNYCLDLMYEHRQPDFWIFGHHHKSIKTKIKDTWFYGLNILELWRF